MGGVKKTLGCINDSLRKVCKRTLSAKVEEVSG